MSTIVTQDGVQLHLHSWPASEPRANAALLHGWGEHGGRYAHVGAEFSKRGISVLAIDFRGHGRSGGRRSHVDRFEEYHLDVDALLAEAKKSAGPTFLMAHSMGSLVALDYVIRKGGSGLRGMVLSSPYLGLAMAVNPIKLGAGKIMSNVLPTLALAAGIKGRDVCRDPEILALYDTDPLNVKKITARLFAEQLAAQERVKARAQEIKLPTLLLYAGDDRIASADATDRVAAKFSMQDRTVERLPGLFHEILNEMPAVRGPLIARMADWILTRSAGDKVHGDAA
jgi:alpha-beta hydrolase superfamily lysophospholipase